MDYRSIPMGIYTQPLGMVSRCALRTTPPLIAALTSIAPIGLDPSGHAAGEILCWNAHGQYGVCRLREACPFIRDKIVSGEDQCGKRQPGGQMILERIIPKPHFGSHDYVGPSSLYSWRQSSLRSLFVNANNVCLITLQH